MSADILESFARAMLTASVAMLVVMILRTPIRRAFGASAAYALWLLAPAAALASFLPARRIVVGIPDAIGTGTALMEQGPPAGVRAALEPSTAWIASMADAFAPVMIGVWALGCVVSLAMILIGYRRLSTGIRLRPLSGEVDVFQAYATGVGPAVIGVLRPRIVVPADFDQRFNAQERALILAHERAHLAAFDVQINALAALALCVGWFNPLFHIARRLLRVDQELACDERVMGSHFRQRRAYADAMLRTQSSRTIALGCAWSPFGESSIRERLAMLARPQVSGLRRALAVPLCAGLMLAACMVAAAAQPPRVVQEGSAEEVQDAQARRDLVRMLDPALCGRWSLMCSGVESAVGDRPDKDESSRLGMHLVLAIQNGDIAQAYKFVDAGADVDFYIPGDGTPLVIAAQKGDYGLVRFLLEAGANVNRAAPGDGAPLIIAAKRGDLAIAELLVKHGADVNVYVPGDETPLINAARNNRMDVARFLIKQGADVNLAVEDRTWIGNERRRSPLGEAERQHHEEMIRLLHEHNASA